MADIPAYRRIADEIGKLILEGHIADGARLPAVRELAMQRGTSVTTAVEVLRLLERRDLVEARPRVGYFARRPRPGVPEPAMSRPRMQARQVRVSDVVAQMFSADGDDASRPVPLGAALPGPELLPSAALQRATARWARRSSRLLTGYGLLDGSPRLRRRLAARYLRCATPLDLPELLITNGCMEAINLALHAVCRPGDGVIVESPCYFGFLQVLEALGLKACEVPTHPRTGLSVAAVERLLSAANGRGIRACIVSPTNSNPSGATMSDADKAALVALCRRHGVALIEDDLYGELQFSGARPLPLRHFDAHGEVMLCGSFSKTLAPGARVGWIAAGRHAAEVRRLKFAASVTTAPLLQEAIADLLEGGVYDRHLRRLRAECERQLRQVTQWVIEAFPVGTRVMQPQGGFLLWVQLPGAADAMALYRGAADEGIEFAPGPLFGSGFTDCLRINCGQRPTPRIEDAIRRLGVLAAELATDLAPRAA